MMMILIKIGIGSKPVLVFSAAQRNRPSSYSGNPVVMPLHHFGTDGKFVNMLPFRTFVHRFTPLL